MSGGVLSCHHIGIYGYIYIYIYIYIYNYMNILPARPVNMDIIDSLFVEICQEDFQRLL